MFDEFDDRDSRVGFVGTKRVQIFEDAKLVGFLFAITVTDWFDDDVLIFAKTLRLISRSELRALTYHGHPRLRPSDD